MTAPPRTQPADRFVQAVALAADVHRTQARKGTQVPYLAHLLAVASLVLEDGGGEDEAIAGLLHDAVEDADVPMAEMLDRIRADFGDRVAGLVAACTDVDPHSGADRSAAGWSARKQHTIDALADADEAAARVLLADKLHNVRCVLTDLAEHGAGLWERFNAGRDDQCWYYTALAHAATPGYRNSRLAREFVRAVDQLVQAAYTAGAPSDPSDWDATVQVTDPCGARHPVSAWPCRRPAGHGGIHARTPRPGDA